MKRHEWWRQQYREARDLDHLSPEQLSLRLFECMNNSRTRTERGKLGILSPREENGERWMVWTTEVFEECVLRGYGYPGPINISGYRGAFEHAFDPIPDMDAALAKYNGTNYLLKFGDPYWLRQSLEKGAFRIAPASFYDKDDHNHARRDKELQRELIPNPRNQRVQKFMNERGIVAPPGKVVSTLTITSPTDYYLFSATTSYTARLFGDFEATACLIIHDAPRFVDRLTTAVANAGYNLTCEAGLVTYYDPVRADPAVVDRSLRFFKPFKHAYQDELRLVWIPSTPIAELQPIFVEIGSLCDCAELVDLTTHPPVELPPDPADAPVIRYGSFNEERDMVNKLPEVAKMMGLSLSREASDHEDWFFEIQYTDSSGAWHEVKMPMLDGLYLLNMLREAEKNQHLGLWNRQ
jgi:hypothetical protein